MKKIRTDIEKDSNVKRKHGWRMERKMRTGVEIETEEERQQHENDRGIP